MDTFTLSARIFFYFDKSKIKIKKQKQKHKTITQKKLVQNIGQWNIKKKV